MSDPSLRLAARPPMVRRDRGHAIEPLADRRDGVLGLGMIHVSTIEADG